MQAAFVGRKSCFKIKGVVPVSEIKTILSFPWKLAPFPFNEAAFRAFFLQPPVGGGSKYANLVIPGALRPSEVMDTILWEGARCGLSY